MNYSEVSSLYRRTDNIVMLFTKQAATIIAMLHDQQRKQGVKGDIFEIGVHHGKSTVFLAGLLAEGERIGVCDIFGDQAENVSASGAGDEGIFRRNMAPHIADDRLEVHRINSLKLKPEDIGGKRFRIFHVDGGHNTDEAYSDAMLAADTLVEGGFIVMDDPLSVKWPGVTEAIVKFLQDRPDFAPVILGFNKMILARKEDVAGFRNVIHDRETLRHYRLAYPLKLKQLPFCNGKLDIFYVPSTRSETSVKSRLASNILARPKLRKLLGR